VAILYYLLSFKFLTLDGGLMMYLPLAKVDYSLLPKALRDKKQLEYRFFSIGLSAER